MKEMGLDKFLDNVQGWGVQISKLEKEEEGMAQNDNTKDSQPPGPLDTGLKVRFVNVDHDEDEKKDDVANGHENVDKEEMLRLLFRNLQFQFPKLTDLVLDLKGLEQNTRLPEEFGDYLIQLECLQVWSCRQPLPASIGQMTELEILRIVGHVEEFNDTANENGDDGNNNNSRDASNKEEEESLCLLPPEIRNLVNLRSLSLSQLPQAVCLPRQVASLVELRKLRILNCANVTSLPTELANLRHLWYLEIRECPKLSLDDLQYLESVEELTIAGTVSTDLPASIGRLQHLRSLEIERCLDLARLPKEIGDLQRLRYLELSRLSDLEALPDEIGMLTSLKTLKINHCYGLTSLPASIGKLDCNLKYLTIKGSPISRLPDEIGNSRGLKELNLSFCETLAELPVGIQHLDKLRTLDLSHCSALQLRKEMPKLLSILPAQLKELFLEGNGITTFDAFLSRDMKKTSHNRRVGLLPRGIQVLFLSENPILSTYCSGWQQEQESLEFLLQAYPKLGSIAPHDGLSSKVVSPYAAFLLAYNERWRPLVVGTTIHDNGENDASSSVLHVRHVACSVWPLALAQVKNHSQLSKHDLESTLIFRILRDGPPVLVTGSCAY